MGHGEAPVRMGSPPLSRNAPPRSPSRKAGLMRNVAPKCGATPPFWRVGRPKKGVSGVLRTAVSRANVGRAHVIGAFLLREQFDPKSPMHAACATQPQPTLRSDSRHHGTRERKRGAEGTSVAVGVGLGW